MSLSCLAAVDPLEDIGQPDWKCCCMRGLHSVDGDTEFCLENNQSVDGDTGICLESDGCSLKNQKHKTFLQNVNK